LGKAERKCPREESRTCQEQVSKSKADECRLSQEIVGTDEGKVGRAKESRVAFWAGAGRPAMDHNHRASRAELVSYLLFRKLSPNTAH